MQLFLILFNLLFPEHQQPGPSFREQVIDTTISIGYGIVLGDVDGDKKPDILLADKKQFVWYRNGDWKKFIIAENLTTSDNVCIAARDLDGDGKVEVAVGAQWNPSETSNDSLSGSVHYLVRPDDLNRQWTPIELHHEPTVHRMRWVKSSKGKYYLVVLPLHGRGNKGGEGAGVKVLAYEFPSDIHTSWRIDTLANDMHLTHNMAIDESGKTTSIFIAGKEGIRVIAEPFGSNKNSSATWIEGKDHSSGEIKLSKNFIAAIQPMHGNKVVVYPKNNEAQKILLDSNLNEGHALGMADFLGNGQEQVVAGWRNPDKDKLTGIRLYSRKDKGDEWQSTWIDRNGMACEDLQVMDLNGDGKPDIVASGRSTHNIKIYWNNSY